MKRFLITACLCLSLLLLLPSAVMAAEAAPATGEESAPAAQTAQSEEEGFFLLVYERLSAHLPEVFSALSLLSACTLAFCYKKGLLPLLRDGIGAIGNATKDWGKAAEKCAEKSEEICKKANNSIQFIEKYTESMQKSIEEIEQRMTTLDDQKREGECLRLLMEGQVELLGDIFLTSSLPQFEKDRVCKRIEEMRAALLRRDSNGGEENA